MYFRMCLFHSYGANCGDWQIRFDGRVLSVPLTGRNFEKSVLRFVL